MAGTMGLKFLLDTNIVSDLLRHPSGAVRNRIAEVGEQAVCISIIVAAELRFGAEKRQSKDLTERVNSVLSAIRILPLDPPMDAHYASIRASLEAAGSSIGPNDLLIAAQARALDLTVVTANSSEFSRVPNLRVENWLEPR